MSILEKTDPGVRRPDCLLVYCISDVTELCVCVCIYIYIYECYCLYPFPYPGQSWLKECVDRDMFVVIVVSIGLLFQ